jgi:hypothetical protein
MAYAFTGEKEDLEAMLADSLHSLTSGSETHPCFYDLRGELGEAQSGAAPLVLELEIATILADHFPGIAEGDPVTVTEKDAWQQQYTVLRIMPSGPLRELFLQRT